MEVTGIDGTYRMICESVMTLLWLEEKIRWPRLVDRIPMLTNAMALTAIDGTYLMTCESVLTLLRLAERIRWSRLEN